MDSSQLAHGGSGQGRILETVRAVAQLAGASALWSVGLYGLLQILWLVLVVTSCSACISGGVSMMHLHDWLYFQYLLS